MWSPSYLQNSFIFNLRRKKSTRSNITIMLECIHVRHPRTLYVHCKCALAIAHPHTRTPTYTHILIPARCGHQCAALCAAMCAAHTCTHTYPHMCIPTPGRYTPIHIPHLSHQSNTLPTNLYIRYAALHPSLIHSRYLRHTPWSYVTSL